MFEKLAQAVIDGEPEDAVELAQQALDAAGIKVVTMTGGTVKEVVEKYLQR